MSIETLATPVSGPTPGQQPGPTPETPPAAAGSYRALLAAYLGPQWGGVLLMATLLLSSTALQLVGPLVVRGFLDAAGAGAEAGALRLAALLFIGLSLAQQVTRVLAGYWSERVAWTATNALRADLAVHLLRLDLGFHKARTPGELMERVDGDVGALAGFFAGFTVQLAGSLLLMLGILVAVSVVDVRLGLAFGLLAVGVLASLSWVRRRGAPHWHQDRAQSAAHYGLLGEVLVAREDLRASAAVPYAMERFFGRLRSWWPVRLRAAFWEQSVMMAAIVAFAGADALAYGLSGGLHRAGAISIGTVYVVVAYAAMLAAPIETLRVQLQDIQKADAAIARIRELFGARSRLTPAPWSAARLPADGPLSVELRGVRFRYEGDDPGAEAGGGSDAGRPATLHDVSFTLAPGRVLGLVGRTGSGKSTVARLLFRFYDPQQGDVRLGGTDLRDADLAEVRSRIGLVTQDIQLFTATLRDNLTFFDSSVPDRRLLDVLEDLGLAPWLSRLPRGLDTGIAAGGLSAGEAQLVALARVFLKRPGLLILDEPSSRLDPATRALLERAIDRLMRRGARDGCTGVIIAHQLATLDAVDDVLLLEDGHQREYGPRERLVADPRSRFAALLRVGAKEVLA